MPRPTLAQTLGATLLLSAAAAANSFGNALSTGPVNDGNFISYATSTLIVPDTPNPARNLAALWVGMGMSNGDLIQAITENYPQSDVTPCGDIPDNEWCSWASVLPKGSYQHSGDWKLTPPGSRVKIEYRYNPSTDEYDQTVTQDGTVISTYSSSQGGKALGWGTAEECQPGNPCGVVPAHQWVDTQLVLNSAYPGYINTIGTNGATGDFYSPDGGLTWECDTISIDAFDFTTGQ